MIRTRQRPPRATIAARKRRGGCAGVRGLLMAAAIVLNAIGVADAEPRPHDPTVLRPPAGTPATSALPRRQTPSKSRNHLRASYAEHKARASVPPNRVGGKTSWPRVARALLASMGIFTHAALADSFTLGSSAGAGWVVGTPKEITVADQRTLEGIAREAGVPYDLAALVNRDEIYDAWNLKTSEGKKIRLPQYIVPEPKGARLVVSRAARLAFLFAYDDQSRPTVAQVVRVSTGAPGSVTPEGQARIVEVVKDPAWFPSKAQQAAYGVQAKVAPGDGNPLGELALQLDGEYGKRGILLHMANELGKATCGQGVTGACVRFCDSDSERALRQLARGDAIRIEDGTTMTGWGPKGRMHVAVYQTLDANGDWKPVSREDVWSTVRAATPHGYPVDRALVEKAIEDPGIPIAVGPPRTD